MASFGGVWFVSASPGLAGKARWVEVRYVAAWQGMAGVVSSGKLRYGTLWFGRYRL